MGNLLGLGNTPGRQLSANLLEQVLYVPALRVGPRLLNATRPLGVGQSWTDGVYEDSVPRNRVR